ncbi:GNAT family N-acetyltransferase [Luteibacter yeojuensis]|uniref:GNAT family N-acetyltransferase n=1 Tax=Luteibacter yeojuensis TaxID=345309 RepID=A0A7X5TR34_9GAMM|nr:GNAT family N-acetyltransferase [Luteibacter yeojuensis]NID17176.1 GNAT family N-acetyltransferase [Luteibacter yeojuensis]
MRASVPVSTALEPEALVEHFLRHPPAGFSAERSPSGMPTFVTPFDLLTTADEPLRKRIAALPLYRMWGPLLRWRTRFAGCTVTEYAPLPSTVAPSTLADELLAVYGRECALFIVKDLPDASPLLDEAANVHAAAFAEALVARGFVLLDGMDLAWVPLDFTSIDDYLGRLSAGRRKNIRRKLRSRALLDVEELPAGSEVFACESLLDECYSLYRNVHAQSEVRFDFLDRAFFASVLRDKESDGVVFLYRADGQLIGWNLCYAFGGMLVDKYIGFAYPEARDHNLYAVSWMHNLEYARQRGFSHFVAGWTDPEVKRQLGARLSRTRHAVYLRHPWLRAAFRRIAHRFEAPPVSDGEQGVSR